jgi:aspartyl-tRNA(Asn)/glutamyl-tRNA(Gln) amidotransferase subunit C
VAVSREDVLHVARLARLRLHESEIELFTHQLNDILAHMEELAEVEAESAGAGALVVEAEAGAPLRADEPGADALLLAPSEIAVSWVEGFFTVPRLPALDADAEAAAS